jgi:hypothetical protein
MDLFTSESLWLGELPVLMVPLTDFCLSHHCGYLFDRYCLLS